MPDAGTAVILDNTDIARRRVGFIDDFFGDSVNGGSFFQISLTGGTVTNLGVGDLGVFGAWSLSTSSSATGRACILSGNTGSFSLGQGVTTWEANCFFSNLSAVAEEYIVRIGFLNATSGVPTMGVYFIYDRLTSANWRIETRSTTATTTTTTTAVSAGAWFRLKIVVNAAGTSASFFVNGVEVSGSPISTNIPVGTGKEVTIIANITKSAGTTGRTLRLDYIAFEIDLTTWR